MKAQARHALIATCSLVLLSCCSKPASMLSDSTGTPGTGQPQYPLVAGAWEVDYEFNGSNFQGQANFAQSGTALSGSGADQDGRRWQVDSGQILAPRLTFNKKYQDADSPAIIYNGELKYLQTPEYSGWAMEGTYHATAPDGSAVGGKWVANPLPASASAPPQQAQQVDQSQQAQQVGQSQQAQQVDQSQQAQPIQQAQPSQQAYPETR